MTWTRDFSRVFHWERRDAAYFLTWKLHGAWQWPETFPVHMSEGQRFVAANEVLDNPAIGPKWLNVPEVAEAVRDVFLSGAASGEYQLGAWVLMPNHVHLLMRPAGELSRVLSNLKGRSARAANLVLNRTGQPFWAKDYFDRWIRDSAQAERTVRYIEQNPVRAGLCRLAEDWRWSSARSRNATKVACPTTSPSIGRYFESGHLTGLERLSGS